MNSMKKFLITDIAQSDILNIKEYIFENNSILVKDFMDLLAKIFLMLSEYPNIGVKKRGISAPDILIYTVRKKYNIIYRIKNENVEVLRVLTRYQNLFAVL